MKSKLTYEVALQELQKILAELEKGNIPLDQISLKVQRANELVAFCKERLRSVESDVNALIEEDDD